MSAAFRARVDLPGEAPLAFEGAERLLEAMTPAEVPSLLEEVERATGEGRWAVGWIGYEAAPAFDPALRTRPAPPGPVAVFGLCDRPVPPARPAGPAQLGPMAPAVGPERHREAVEAIRARIAAGAVYQVNLTLPLAGPFAGDPLALYERLLGAQGAGRGAFVAAGSRAVVSASPELFFERVGRRVRARPMKGTRPRGRYPEEDDRLADELAASPKDRAENVMIVDLLRNDLGRVAPAGGVRAGPLFEVERYRTVLQLVSTVEARLAEGTSLVALVGALFPCGSVTGAPKIAAMRAIAELEEAPRGPYCGAVGVVRPGGDAAFSVAIRTVTLDLARGEATCGVGGGITWDSDPAAEWAEAMVKAAFLEVGAAPPALVETLRCEGGAYPLLARHLARLEGSARHLGVGIDVAAARAALLERARTLGPGAHRVRLVAREGGVGIEAAPAPAEATAPAPVALASRPVSRTDWRLFHKTTSREPYEACRVDAAGAFDVLLWNEEGEATEFTIGNLVAEIDGVQWTPPVACGLLAGVMRAELLARGEILERVVRVDELGRATRLWLVNAVRGRVPVRLVSPG